MLDSVEADAPAVEPAEAIEAPAAKPAAKKKSTTRRKRSSASSASTKETASAVQTERAAPRESSKEKTKTKAPEAETAKRKPSPRTEKKAAPEKSKAPAREGEMSIAEAFLANFSSGGSKRKPEVEEVDVPVWPLPAHPEHEAPSQLIAQGRAWLEGLFEAMGLAIKADGSYDERDACVRFDLSGEGVSRLLGPRNASPKLLETTEKILSVFFEQGGLNSINVLIDSDGFRDAQSRRIERVAEALAELVLERDATMMIVGLDDSERRVIHRQVGEGRGLRTESVGYGSFRKLKLQPE